MTATVESQQLMTDLQTKGLRIDNKVLPLTRKGGAGPSDHQAIVVDGQSIMVPVFTEGAEHSPYRLGAGMQVELKGIPLVDITMQSKPRFYELSTKDGIPYSKIATLHSTDVLATTVLQECIRYGQEDTSCQFCSIGQSLEAGKTIAQKTPDQLAEVALAAYELDGVSQMVMTTGTPPTADRGAAMLAECVKAVKAAVPLPIQVQCEPPKDLSHLRQLKAVGADSIGMHLEAVSERVRQKVMASKANIRVSEYLKAFEYAVELFGRGNVSTYILAGLGDTQDEILSISQRCLDIGVYPFVVPFVPISGTRLANHPPPSTEFMDSILEPLSQMIVAANLDSDAQVAGCAKCGACSSLKRYERVEREKVEYRAEAG